MTKRLCVLAIALFLCSPVHAENDVEVRSDLGSLPAEDAIDVVILSEGYANSDRKEFFRDARKIGRRLRKEKVSAPLRKVYDFHIHAVFVPSQDSGAPWTPGQESRKTQLKARVLAEAGDLDIDEGQAELLAATHAPDVDVTLVLIHFLEDDSPDAETSPIPEIVSSRDHLRAVADVPDSGGRILLPSHDTEAFIHELGHALIGLGDEYWTEEVEIPEESKWEVSLSPNLSTDETGARWKHILPTVFEGGSYYKYGVYRGAKNCRMKQTRSRNFCAVCLHSINESATMKTPKPAAWITPKSRMRLRATDGQAVIDAAWKSEDTPLYWAIEVEDLDRSEIVWEDYIEGHFNKVKIPFGLQSSGRFRITITAVNNVGTSSTRQRTIRVTLPLRTPGISGALRRSE